MDVQTLEVHGAIEVDVVVDVVGGGGVQVHVLVVEDEVVVERIPSGQKVVGVTVVTVVWITGAAGHIGVHGCIGVPPGGEFTGVTDVPPTTGVPFTVDGVGVEGELAGVTGALSIVDGLPVGLESLRGEAGC